MISDGVIVLDTRLPLMRCWICADAHEAYTPPVKRHVDIRGGTLTLCSILKESNKFIHFFYYF